jgi:hypothetical protein
LPNPTEDLAKHVIEAEPLYDNRGRVTIRTEEWNDILDLALEIEDADNVQG